MIRVCQRLGADRRGVTLVEFAFVAPVLLMLIMGLGDLAYQAYVQSVLTGAIQKAGRDSGLETSDPTAIDDAVEAAVLQVAHKATFVPAPTRESFSQFSDIGPEPFTDSNGNGVHDATECFTDVNGNGTWDADPGSTGQGGASDVTVYTVSVKYPRLFPVATWIGWGKTVSLSAKTILKNQPYKAQTVTVAKTICP